MHIAMIGVDFNSANIEVRERFSFTASRKRWALAEICPRYAESAVILATCNRTEIYLVSEKRLADMALTEIFLHVTESSAALLNGRYYIYREWSAADYLFELACGLHSMILGEDQITTQVNEAAKLAIESGTGGPLINTLFRHGVTCGKRAKTSVNIKHLSPSVVEGAIQLLEPVFTLPKARVLVIGSGIMGRLTAEKLLEKGCSVCMTVRQYKNQPAMAFECGSEKIALFETVSYEDRIKRLEWADVVVSATKSPHFTLTKTMLEECTATPKYFLDLALPRDIDPEISSIQGVQCWNVDDISAGVSPYDLDDIERIKSVIAQQKEKFYGWLNFRNHDKRAGADGF